MDYRVILSHSARTDLRDIVRYISLDDPNAAIRFGRLLILQARRLVRFPELGRVAPEFQDPVIREIIVRSYRVVYRLDHSHHLIEVIRFWHSARDLPQIDLSE